MSYGIIFDMDGVIIDNNHFHFQAWQEVCSKYGKVIDDHIYREQMNGRTLKALVKFIFEKEMSDEEAQAVGHEKEALYRKLYQPYLEPAHALFPLLSAAHAEKIPMVIGTSAPVENVRFTMEGLGIRHYFKAILDDRSVTRGKPDPEIYQKCAQAAGLPNNRCVVIEDAVSGLQAGKAAGSKTIGIATSHKAEELSADLIINDFSELTLQQIKELIDS
jgi:beta-phosphoglucomutase